MRMDRLTELKRPLDALRPLSAEQVRLLWPMWDKEDVLYVQTSNAIEGNTLTLAETTVVVEHGITIGGHSVREHLEAINGVKAYHLMLETARNKTPITRNTVLALHEALFPQEAFGGAFRDEAVFIRGATYVQPDAKRVRPYMDRLFQMYEEAAGSEHPVISGALLAFYIVTIHPFVDGNGRISRLLNNLHLLQHGYPPVLIDPATDKPAYFEALAAGQRDEDVFQCNANPFYAFMTQMEERSLERYLNALRIANGE